MSDATPSTPPEAPTPGFSFTIPVPFRQPKPGLRWLAVILGAGGWYISALLFNVSIDSPAASPLLQAVCGGSKVDGKTDDCTSVLTSPQAYVAFSNDPSAMRIPVSTFGMAYFAFVALWYVFIGPPTRGGRAWHVLLLAVVLFGAWQSVEYIRIMKFELQRWCAGCLIAHALNGGLVLLSLGAWPWRSPKLPAGAHPSARLALATTTVGVLLLIVHVTYAWVGRAGAILGQRTKEYSAVLNDPEFVLWDLNRQPVASIPIRGDEVFGGAPDAPNTLVVFGDFQCSACKLAHERLVEVAGKYPGRLRVAFRNCPQDPECNPNPRFRSGGHASGCRAARAAEAARMIGGREKHLEMRTKLWDHQSLLPKRPLAQQTEVERNRFEDWAAELGLDRAAFSAAMESPEAAARIQADVELARQLGLEAMPVLYLNGRRLRTWGTLPIWDALLRIPSQTATDASDTGP